MKNILRLVLLFFLLSSCSGTHELQKSKFSVLDSLILHQNNATISLIMMNADDSVIIDYHSDRLMIPASLTKLFFAKPLLNIRTDTTFNQTIFRYVMPDQSLEIETAGNPLLTSSEILTIVDSVIAKNLKVKTIRILPKFYDLEEKWGVGWMYDDEPGNYQPIMNDFPIDENLTTLTLQIKNNIATIQLSPIEEEMIHQRNQKFLVKRNRFNEVLTIEYPVVKNDTVFTRKISLNNPTTSHMVWLQKIFQADSILRLGHVYKIPDTTQTQIVWKIKHHVDSLYTKVFRDSNNFTTEQILRFLAIKRGLPGSFSSFKTLNQEFFPFESVLVDGSGLSRYNLISPRNIINILSYVKHDSQLVNSLALYGVTGTVKDRLKLRNGLVFLVKSGSMTGIQNVAGLFYYNGKMIGSAVLMMNNVNLTKRDRYQLEQAILEACSNFLINSKQ